MSSVAYRAPRRRRRKVSRRLGAAGPLTYVGLGFVAIISVFPLYWSLVVASHTNAAVYEYPPKLLPGSNLFHNIHRLFNAGIVNVDFSIIKNTRIRERWNVQFRVESFNFANHVNLLPPNTSFVPGVDGRNSSSTFGTITSARDARIIQLGLKLLF